MSVKITAYTMPICENTDSCTSPQEYLVWAARVSNPGNQANHDTGEKLLKYCIRKRHWSVFEQVDVSMEIRCPRDISRQILRHSSFRFQEYSQRYAVVDLNNFEPREARMQDAKDRQSSLPCANVDIYDYWQHMQRQLMNRVKLTYDWAINAGIAKEVARTVLPEGLTESTVIMKGSVRSWIHYCEVRQAPET